MKTVTWNRILEFRPCGQRLNEVEKPYGWLKAINYWRPKDLDEEVSIPMVLESNGLDNAVWALCAFKKDYEREWWMFKADIAELVLPIFEERYPDNKAPRKAIEGARLFADGKISKEELKSRADAAACVAVSSADEAYTHTKYTAARKAVAAVRAAATAKAAVAARSSAFTANAAGYTAYSTYVYAEAASFDYAKIENILLKYFGE